MWYQLYNRKYGVFEEGKNSRREFSTSQEVLNANQKLRKRGTSLAWVIAHDQDIIKVHMNSNA